MVSVGVLVVCCLVGFLVLVSVVWVWVRILRFR